VAAGPGLGGLSALEMKRLHPRQQGVVISEVGGRVLVEISTVGLLFLGQHAAFAGADTGAGQLGAGGQRNLRLFGQRPETHVTDQQWDFEPQRLACLRPDHQVGANGHVLEQRLAGQLGGHELDVIPVGKLAARHPHRRHLAIGPQHAQPLPSEAVDEGDGRLLRGRNGSGR